MDKNETHLTSVNKISLHVDGIIISEPIEEMTGTIELSHAKEAFELIKQVKGNRRLIVVHTRDGKISQEARQYFSDCEPIFDKVAIIAMGPLQILVANFFLGINKPKMPLRLFKTEEKALVWLKK